MTLIIAKLVLLVVSIGLGGCSALALDESLPVATGFLIIAMLIGSLAMWGI